MSVLLEAIEIVAEDVCAHAGSLKIDPDDDGDDVDRSHWLQNNGLADDLFDLADLINRAAAIVHRPRVRTYLAAAPFPQSRRLATLFVGHVDPPPALAAYAPPKPPAIAPARLRYCLLELHLQATAINEGLLLHIAGVDGDLFDVGDAAAELRVHASNLLRTCRRLERGGWLVLDTPAKSGRGGHATTYRIAPQLRALIELGGAR